MSRNRVIVEINPENGQVVRLFRHNLDALKLDPSIVRELPRSEAVLSVRKFVYARSNQLCERCGHPVTWNTGQMDERIAKSEGGEVSQKNCWYLCHACHQGREDSEHGNRRLRFGEQHQ